jgi:hypothetical protein
MNYEQWWARQEIRAGELDDATAQLENILYPALKMAAERYAPDPVTGLPAAEVSIDPGDGHPHRKSLGVKVLGKAAVVFLPAVLADGVFIQVEWFGDKSYGTMVQAEVSGDKLTATLNWDRTTGQPESATASEFLRRVIERRLA